MTRKDDAGLKSAARFLARPLIVAVAVVIAIVIYIVVIRPEPPTAVAPENLDMRPTGAGTLPDGAAGELVGNPEEETVGDEIIQGSGASDLRPNILDAGEGPPPAATVDELDLPDHIDPNVIEPGPPGGQPPQQ